jgi:hypothetical protein
VLTDPPGGGRVHARCEQLTLTLLIQRPGVPARHPEEMDALELAEVEAAGDPSRRVPTTVDVIPARDAFCADCFTGMDFVRTVCPMDRAHAAWCVHTARHLTEATGLSDAMEYYLGISPWTRLDHA